MDVRYCDGLKSLFYSILQVKNNFCLNTLGHGYFLEDGGEKRTVLEGNLGAGQKKATLIPSDK